MVLCLLTGAGGDCLAAPQAQENRQRLNILFLLADDLRWDGLGCAGNRFVPTPHIDELASKGVRFKNHFVTTPICNVSRASIFTGQYKRRHGITDFATPFTPAQWSGSYPALLRKLGYRTGFIGKFGVGDEAAVKAMAGEFDYWRGLPGQAGLFFDPNDPEHRHKTARFGDEAIEFLRQTGANQPFCLSISFNAPHARDGQIREFEPDPRDEALLSNITIPAFPKRDETWFQKLPEFVKISEGRKRWEKRFATPDMFQRTVKDYYRLIAGIDREVGRLRQTLEEKQLASTTVIVLTSDNGFFLGERGLADKWFLYEESIRVPLVILDPRTPRASRGKTIDALSLNIDFAPTFLDLAGMPTPANMQGRSLVPLWMKKTPDRWRTEFLCEHDTLPKIIPKSEGVRTRRWKYLRWTEADPPIEELYDLREDPLEEHNLAASNRHRSVLSDMRRTWKRLIDQGR